MDAVQNVRRNRTKRDVVIAHEKGSFQKVRKYRCVGVIEEKMSEKYDHIGNQEIMAKLPDSQRNIRIA